MPEETPSVRKPSVVVVVEDDRYILDFIRFTLEQQDYQVLTAEDGLEGLSLIQNHLPVLVVLDLMLPKMDGFTVLKRLSEQPQTARIPVIVMSAYTASESTRRMIQNQKNVRDVFTKPIRTKDFVARLEQIVNAK